MMAKVQAEKEYNRKILIEYQDKPITFGSSVQLMHYDSKSYVVGSSECSQTIKIGYKCYLSHWYSKGMVFRILPKLKSRNEGDCIQYKDMINFENIESSAYLSFCFSQESKILSTAPLKCKNNPFR